jgi:hypothetical protein
MYEIVLADWPKTVYYNEKIIREIEPNEDGSYTLIHFNDVKVKIRSFKKL